jgi:hypothetical protein
MSASHKQNRHCDCGTRVSDQSKTGRCLRCNLRLMDKDPEITKRRADALRKRLAEDPVERQRRSLQMKINRRNAVNNPVACERILAAALRNLPKAWTPESIAKKIARQAEGNRKLAERKIAWCPPEYREEYRRLVYRRRIPSTEARRIILGMARAATEALSPFERQMRALQNGARIIANDPLPAGNQVVRRVG